MWGLRIEKKKDCYSNRWKTKAWNHQSNLHFGSAPYFAFIDVEEGQIVGSYVKANEGAKLSHKKGIQAARLLVKEKVDVVLAGDLEKVLFTY